MVSMEKVMLKYKEEGHHVAGEPVSILRTEEKVLLTCKCYSLVEHP